MARRIGWDEPCLTLTCSPAQKQTERCHPDETRPFTVREYARIQTFPDHWKFEGSVSQQYKQIGNAVPPLVAKAIDGSDPVHKISIIPRGIGALGYTLQRPTEDRFIMEKEELYELLKRHSSNVSRSSEFKNKWALRENTDISNFHVVYVPSNESKHFKTLEELKKVMECLMMVRANYLMQPLL